MDFPVVLAHLQSQFSGQMVLYVDDLAKVLGRSDKAVSNLIARDALPFKVKTVGAKRCVDIFQVAQWLSSDESMATESVKVDATPPAPRVNSKPVKPLGQSKGQVRLASDEVPVLTGNVAAMILKMRHSQASAMGRFVHSLQNLDELVFMNEVMEKLFYASDQLSSSYVVTIKKLAPRGARVLAEEIRKYFETEELAVDVLMLKLNGWRFSKAVPKNKLVEHFVLEESGNIIFHAIGSDRKLAVVVNSSDIELPGL